ncbi:hypothetical protein NYZ99_16150 [Maribacter litopenaei]|uniref:Cbb3-type cytochrome oxidase assembly protein CcoS n=1 Tax=Maribacter litopenaei TaxID=2976127 RepID=A0ABY5Y8Z9_9FLAO|nr:hypothetical protein [Maribacter litopenaei]UWX54436.1 hypothetical protein NYZ99_16150 [Maribacter litopenaei]
MISIVELIGGVSILMASGFLLIFIKESVFDQTTEPELEFQNTDSSESFINIDIDSLADDGTTKNDTEQVKEKRRRLESFKLRNKFYH